MKAEWTNKDSLSCEETTKAILVLNKMPKSCDKCDYCGYAIIDSHEGDEYRYRSCGLAKMFLGEINEDYKSESCPLKPMPNIKTEEAIKLANMINPKATFQEFADGWNACLKELEK